MSLREQWAAGRVQRKQEVLPRQQEVSLDGVSQRAANEKAVQNYVWGTTSTANPTSKRTRSKGRS